MNAKEIFRTLEEGANMKFEFKNGKWHGFGAINNFHLCKEGYMTPAYYTCKHYPEKKQILESIPWNVVENPRSPKPEEYPSEDGEYITMLDADEHAVWTNTFKDGHWLVYDRTHVKWWIPLPDMEQYKTRYVVTQEEIENNF